MTHEQTSTVDETRKEEDKPDSMVHGKSKLREISTPVAASTNPFFIKGDVYNINHLNTKFSAPHGYTFQPQLKRKGDHILSSKLYDIGRKAAKFDPQNQTTYIRHVHNVFHTLPKTKSINSELYLKSKKCSNYRVSNEKLAGKESKKAISYEGYYSPQYTSERTVNCPLRSEVLRTSNQDVFENQDDLKRRTLPKDVRQQFISLDSTKSSFLTMMNELKHKEEDTQAIACPFCGLTFKEYRDLKSHVQSHRLKKTDISSIHSTNLTSTNSKGVLVASRDKKQQSNATSVIQFARKNSPRSKNTRSTDKE